MTIKRANGHGIGNAQEPADLRDLTPTEGQPRMRPKGRKLRLETVAGEDAGRMQRTFPHDAPIPRRACSEDGTLQEMLRKDTRGRA
jgi:hypothetical protein